jgi:hypothetical protein
MSSRVRFHRSRKRSSGKEEVQRGKSLKARAAPLLKRGAGSFSPAIYEGMPGLGLAAAWILLH